MTEFSKNTQVPQTIFSGSFFDKTFRKIPIIIYKDFNETFNKKMWYCEVADDYPNYKQMLVAAIFVSCCYVL